MTPLIKLNEGVFGSPKPLFLTVMYVCTSVFRSVFPAPEAGSDGLARLGGGGNRKR